MKGNLIDAGDIRVGDVMGRRATTRVVPNATLVQFPSEEDFLAAIAERRAEFTMFDPAPELVPVDPQGLFFDAVDGVCIDEG